MILHACSLANDADRIIIRCDDTDVLVLLVYYFSRGQLNEHVYMYAGHSGKERYIPVHIIADQLGPTVCQCLPAAHALTGCDTTCSLNRIGKKTAYSTLLKNADTLSALKTFHSDNLEDSITVARSYALHLYGKKGKEVGTLDELRYHLATTTDKAAAMLPPTEDSFKQHVLRAKYQTQIWCGSDIANQEVVDPVGHGWSSCSDGGITQIMFTQAAAPVEFRKLTHLYCTDKDCLDEKKCPCLLAGLWCIEACCCKKCQNQYNIPEGGDEMEMNI